MLLGNGVLLWGPGGIFGFPPLPKWAGGDAAVWERADKPQTKLVQTVRQVHKVKLGVLGGAGGVLGGTSRINDKTLDGPFRQVLKTSQCVLESKKGKNSIA